VVLAMFVFQRSLIYVPDAVRKAPSETGLSGITEETIVTPDGARLVAWWLKAKPGHRTLLYFHGNGGHLVDRAPRFKIFDELGLGVLMLAYRGYSGSTGNPSEAANVADGLLAFDFLTGRGVPTSDIVLFGESLGTGVAAEVAQARPAAGLVLDSPYTSLAAVGQWHYPWLPVTWLLLDRYDTLTRIGQLHLPLLILHGEADEIVPVAMGRAVFAAANEPKKLMTYPGAKHIHHLQFGSMTQVREFAAGLMP
jgi:uncharacterized protein